MKVLRYSNALGFFHSQWTISNYNIELLNICNIEALRGNIPSFHFELTVYDSHSSKLFFSIYLPKHWSW